MSSSRELPKDIVLIAFSDTHGDSDHLARLYTLIEKKINEDREKNPKVKHVLLLPGDVFSVNRVFSVISKGQFDIDTISEIAKLFPEDSRFFVPGNHDFYYDEETLIKLVGAAKLRVVISNTKFEAHSKLKFEALSTLTIGESKLTMGGLMTPETLNTAGGKKVIRDEKSIDTCPADFKRTPPDIILSHLGSTSDKELPFKKIIIVGGHSHDRQIDVRDERLVVNTGAGECAVVISEGGKTEIIEAKEYEPSPRILDIVSRYNAEHKIDLKQPIFSIAADSILPSGLELAPKEAKAEFHLRMTDSIITRVTADGIVQQLREAGENIDFALYPNAAIRSNFTTGQQITYQELFETYYFNNRLAKMKVTGAELVALLAHGVMSGYKCVYNRGQLLTPSEGLSYGYDIEQENPADTIQWVRVNGRLINPNSSYIIVTTDWFASEVPKLFKHIQIEFFPENIKIFKLVAEHLKGRELRESFCERIRCAQSLEYQDRLSQQEGNRRADKPKFDRYNIRVNLDFHQANYLVEPTLHAHIGLGAPSVLFPRREPKALQLERNKTFSRETPQSTRCCT